MVRGEDAVDGHVRLGRMCRIAILPRYNSYNSYNNYNSYNSYNSKQAPREVSIPNALLGETVDMFAHMFYHMFRYVRQGHMATGQ